MEVVSLSRASQLTQQLYSSSVRLFASSFSTSLQQQHQHQQLIALCTLLTVALSVLLFSLNKHYPNYYYPTTSLVVTRCLRCLTYVRRRVSIAGALRLPRPPPISINKKLKRLRTLAYLPTASTTAAAYYNYYTSYLLRPLNKMRKKLRVKNIISIKSGVMMASKYGGQWSTSSRRNQTTTTTAASNNNASSSPVNIAASSPSLYCPACDAAVVGDELHRRRHEVNEDTNRNIAQSKSYPVFSAATNRHQPHNHYHHHHHQRNLAEPRINNSKVVKNKYFLFCFVFVYS